MNTRKAILLGVAVVFVGVLCVQAWRWRQPLQTREEVFSLVEQAQSEIEKFEKAGGKSGAPDHPGRKWAETLLNYRRAHPHTLYASMTEFLAVEYFSKGVRWEELLARAKSLPLGDPVVGAYLQALYARARSEQQCPAFIAYVEELREKTSGDTPQDQTMRARLNYFAGRAYDALNDAPQSRAAFERAIKEAPSSYWARDSRTGIYELEHLSRGLPAPQFVGTGLDGKPIALADLRGKTIVLDFWGKG